ncbi:helicase-exonuclease AddAB subunit AddA [Romboutsia weinsteinii]|uniref:ATP-dependent helicase/nuclease subunit A n=1 Tax=Romboutsia weinsteinii TaxID=2020949 RepID=A0A371IZU6_9FIRM|nr:helicase-exonuclease AddAB subunit AddA [Romboutsia weinsteinii]RDY25964.1 helicase-exonuclease AddAB subunit AddA [Romboutsia weinsteinii]
MSSPKWTTEQQAVIDSRNCNLLVAAAAGSGKTAVLVERIIQMITDKSNPIDIDKLLVVTFTNAAASEMRERVGDAIGKALDKNPENKHLQNQLVLLNKASITTIHSFCLEVIKSNFHKINLDPNFRIGDQTECSLLKMEAIDDVFEELYEAKDEGFLNLVESYAEKRGDNELQNIILSIYSFAMASPYPKQWLDESVEIFNISDDFNFSESIWAQSILDTVRIEVNGIEVSMRKALSQVEGIDELDTFTEKLRSEYNKIVRIVEACNKSWDDAYMYMSTMEFENYVKGVKRIAKDAPSYIKEAKDTAKSIRDKAKKSLEGIISSTFYKKNEYINDEIKYLYPIVKSISDTILKFEKAYDNKKRDKGIIDFNDIEHFALKILTMEDEDGNVIPSDIAIGYRDKFYEIFIDEYQDSNLVQEVLLSTIAKIQTPNRFMVGDVKQSIYRFRQAKPEIFLQKYNDYDSKEGSLYRKIMLYKNFRSRAEVVDCANYIFENVMSKNIGEIEYTENERLNLGASFKENEDENTIVGGPTEIHIIQKSNKNNSEPDSDNEEVEQEEIDNIQLEARMVGKIIKDLMTVNEDGKTYKVYDKKTDEYRTVEFKDIVILLRATSAWAPVFADELMNMDIPTYADIGVGYFDTIEIKTILSLLQVIDNPMQDIPVLALLKSPIFGLTPEELIDIRLEDKNKSFYESLEDYAKRDFEDPDECHEKCIDFLERIKEYKEKSLYMSTDEFLWYLYTKTGYYAYVGALPAGSQRQANLKILFERAKQYEETSFKGIFNFINFIGKLKKSSTDMGSAKTLGENANVVRIMSIHKSKGLEFPVVICSGMGKNFNTQDFKKNILYHHRLGYGPQLVDYHRRISFPSIAKEALKTRINLENLSEEMRVLYVAFTRPKEKLIITGSTKDIETSMKKWSSGIDGSSTVSQYEVLKGKNFLDWIMPSVIKHKDLNSMRESIDLDIEHVEDHKSKWIGKIWYKEDVVLETKEDEEKESIEEILEKIDINELDSTYYNDIKDKLDYKYPYEVSVNKPSSISVTEIKKIQNNHEEDYSKEIFNTKVNLKKPLFLQKIEEKDKISAAERGTIVHLIMEILDLTRINTIDDINLQIKEFISKGIMTEKQSSVINPFKIYKFFKSNIGKRMLNAEFIKREQAIYAQIKMKDVYIYEDLLNEDNSEIYDEESIMLRGIIDTYFEEDGKIVLLDYKTDFVNDDNKEEVVLKYKKQLDLYKDVLENLTGKDVKEKYIYLFGIDEEVPC